MLAGIGTVVEPTESTSTPPQGASLEKFIAILWMIPLDRKISSIIRHPYTRTYIFIVDKEILAISQVNSTGSSTSRLLPLQEVILGTAFVFSGFFSVFS